jgi:tRNA-splicing ligase RtcB
MIPYQGKYGKACVMLNELNDQNTISQIYGFLNHPAFTKSIAIMPDCHYGKGAVIGFTMEMTDMIIPNIVGVDINCGMLSLFFGANALQKLSKEEIDLKIRQKIPLSKNVHKETALANTMLDTSFWKLTSQYHQQFTLEYNKRYGTIYQPIEYDMKWLENKCKQINMDFRRALLSIGTLGGGNHFLELGKLVNKEEYLFTIHSGSRQLGTKVCDFWQRKAGKGPLAYLTGNDMFGYLTDMIFAQQYAQTNRDAMAMIIQNIFHIEAYDTIETSHNFIDFRDFIIRKGAIRSYKGERMIIPFNMEDGLLICDGKSNSEWNYSAPHGAGRISSRSAIKKKMKQTSSQELIKERMKNKGIYISIVPMDETKEAYKDPKIIEEAIKPTATIIDRAIPVINIKAI